MTSEKYIFYIDFGLGFVKTDIYDNKLVYSWIRDEKDIALVELKISGSMKLKGTEFTTIDNIAKNGITKDVPIKIYRDGDSGTGTLIFNGFFNKFNDFDYNEKTVTIKEFQQTSKLNEIKAYYDKELAVQASYRNFFNNITKPIYCNISYSGVKITDYSYTLVGIINNMLAEYADSIFGDVLCNEDDFWYNPINAKFNVKYYRIANLRDVFTGEGEASKLSLQRLLEILAIMHKVYWYISETGQRLKFKTIRDLDPTKLDLSNELMYKNRRVLNYGMNIKSEGISFNDNNIVTEDDNYTFSKNKIVYAGIANKSNDYRLSEVCTRYTEEGEDYNIDGFFFAYVDPVTNKMICQNPSGLTTNYDNAKFSLRNLIYENYRDYMYTENKAYQFCNINEYMDHAHIAPFIEVPEVELIISNPEVFIDSYISQITTDNRKIILVYEQNTDLLTNITVLKGFEFANSKYDLADIPPIEPDLEPDDTLTLDKYGITFGNAGGSIEVDVFSNTDWVVESPNSMAEVYPLSGSGNGSITVTVVPKTYNRGCNVYISTDEINVTLRVTQRVTFPNLDSITVSPGYITSDLSSKIFQLILKTSGYWSVVKESWMALNYINGTDDENLTLTLNASTLDRTGYLTFTRGTATATVRVEQKVAAAALYVSPASLTFDYNANINQFIDIVTEGSWTITSSNANMVYPLQSSGINTSRVEILCNSTFEARTAILTVTNGTTTKTVNIIQTKAPDFINVNNNPYNINSGVEILVPLYISSNVGWYSVTFPNWITPDKNIGSNMDTIWMTVAATSANRTGTIVITDGTIILNVTINQYYAVIPVSLSVTPLVLTYPSSVALGAVNYKQIYITTTGTWYVSSNKQWLTPNISSGSGLATINITALENTSVERTGTIKISNGTNSIDIAVTQEAAYVFTPLTVTPLLLTFDYNPSSDLPIEITTDGDWTITSSNANMVYPLTESGSGNATVYILCNDTFVERTCRLTIRGEDDTKYVDIVQTAAPAFIDANPPSPVNILGGQAMYMPLYISSNVDWYRITAPSWIALSVNEGSGMMTVWLTIQPTSITRTGTITISNLDNSIVTETDIVQTVN